MDGDHLTVPTNLLTPQSKGFGNSLKSAFRRLSIRSITSRGSVVQPHVRQPAETFSIFADPEAPFNFKVPDVIINDGLGSVPTTPRPNSRFTIGSPEPYAYSTPHSSRQSSIVSFIPFNVPEIHIDDGLGSGMKFTIRGNPTQKPMDNLDDEKLRGAQYSCGLSWIVHMICLRTK